MPSFSVAMLYSEVFRVVMQRRKEKCSNGERLEWRSTPMHISNSKHPREIPIELCKRSLIDVADFSGSRSAEPIDDLLSDVNYVASSTYLDLMSLSCKALDERLNPEIDRTRSPDTDSTSPNSPDEEPPECMQTLKVPHMLISVELDQDHSLPSSEACRRWISSFPSLAKHVKVDGVYQGYSTVLILSIPIVIWNTLPNHPACRPITYVTSRNLLQDIPTTYGRRRVSMATPDSVLTPTTLSNSFHNDLNEEYGTLGINTRVPERGPQDSAPFLNSAVANYIISQSTSAKGPKSTLMGYIMSNATDDVSSRRGRHILQGGQKDKLADGLPRVGRREQPKVQPPEDPDKPDSHMSIDIDDQSFHMASRDLAQNVFPTDQIRNAPPTSISRTSKLSTKWGVPRFRIEKSFDKLHRTLPLNTRQEFGSLFAKFLLGSTAGDHEIKHTHTPVVRHGRNASNDLIRSDFYDGIRRTTDDDEPPGDPTQTTQSIISPQNLVIVDSDQRSEQSDSDDQANEYKVVFILQNLDGGTCKLPALFDTGSPSNFITSKAIQKIGRVAGGRIPPSKMCSYLGPFAGERNTTPRHYVRLNLYNEQIGLDSNAYLRILEANGFDIILGRNFIHKNGGASLLARISEASNSDQSLTAPTSSHFTPLVKGKRLKGMYYSSKNKGTIVTSTMQKKK